MWLVVGLGNPGDMYAGTRHNIGFMVIDALAAENSLPLKGRAKNYIYGRGFIREKSILLIKPLTFMNRSGIAVAEALKRHEDIDNVLVVCDDIDLDTGVIRIKKTGSSGGHKGVESIIGALGANDFIRLKIGVGRSGTLPVEQYVLKNFTRREKPVIGESIGKAAEAITVIVNKGVSHAQNIFHRAKRPKLE
ncbi:MAG: aminoacyl-tRNA hydrolase [Nitrospiraceae bacterium]|nr:MAG: aminoacyl-tRNA hydrolase [Nitrospiraceae bacterium]